MLYCYVTGQTVLKSNLPSQKPTLSLCAIGCDMGLQNPARECAQYTSFKHLAGMKFYSWVGDISSRAFEDMLFQIIHIFKHVEVFACMNVHACDLSGVQQDFEETSSSIAI